MLDHTRWITRTVCLLAALQAANVTAADTSGDWQQFRGPRGDGVSIDAQPPTTWSAEHNIRWKTPLGPAFALKLERARGDVTATHRLWRVPEYAQSIGSGLLLDGVYYMANAGPGIVECLDAAPGRVLWKDRATDGNHWSSIVRAGNMMYATNQEGTTLVFAPSREGLQRIATNALGEPTNATPALAGEHLYFRTSKHLICVGP